MQFKFEKKTRFFEIVNLHQIKFKDENMCVSTVYLCILFELHEKIYIPIICYMAKMYDSYVIILNKFMDIIQI